MMKTPFAIAARSAVGLSLAQPALGQSDDNELCIVNFETSCEPEARKLFNDGMLYQHSFLYRASQKVFEDALKADPECCIAYWGIAPSLLWNPHTPAPAKNLGEGAAAIARGKGVGAKSQCERDYLDAIAVMYADDEKVDHRTRIQAYAKAMEQLAQRYPNDDEAQIHYALALNTSASPTGARLQYVTTVDIVPRGPPAACREETGSNLAKGSNLANFNGRNDDG